MRTMNQFFLLLAFVMPCFSESKVEYLTPTLIDFGKVREGQALDGEIKFVNRGNEPLVIGRVQPGCGCTVANVEKKSYDPGEKATISFTLKTNHFRGLIRKGIQISFKNEDVPNERFTIQAQVTTDLEMTPQYLHFRNLVVNPDTMVTKYVKFKNSSNKKIHISKADYRSDLFRIIPETFSVPIGETYLLRVELKPKAVTRENTVVTFSTDLKEKPEVKLHVYSYIKPKAP